jgi:hypothetical protein
MNRELEWREPYGRGDWQLVRGKDHGVYWKAGDGLEVRLAAPERERRLETRALGEVDALEARDGIFAR